VKLFFQTEPPLKPLRGSLSGHDPHAAACWAPGFERDKAYSNEGEQSSSASFAERLHVRQIY
jgi:hypothetical protein